MNRHLLVFVGLAGATALTLLMSPTDGPVRSSVPLQQIPLRVGSWQATGDVPEHVLPRDPRALGTLRRSYENGHQRIWLSVARYSSINRPESRPAIDKIVVARLDSNVAALRTSVVPLDAVKHVAVRGASQDYHVIYWYQLGSQVISGEYALRFWLFWQTLWARPLDLLLVRIAAATPADAEDFITTIYPRLLDLALSGSKGRAPNDAY